MEPTCEVRIPERLPRWLEVFVRDALKDNDTLIANGARHAAVARAALMNRLIEAAVAYQETEVDVGQAAVLTGRHPETIRRAVKAGTLPDRRTTPRGHHRIRRADLETIGLKGRRAPYDPHEDARQLLARRRDPSR